MSRNALDDYLFMRDLLGDVGGSQIYPVRKNNYSITIETFRKPDGTFETQVKTKGREDLLGLLASEADLKRYIAAQEQEIEVARARGKNITNAKRVLTNESFLGFKS